MNRRAKIVCTLGPATSTQERINALITTGLDVARLNLSHGSHADHLNSYRLVRAGSDAIGRSVGVLADLQGPKIRLGEFPGGPVLLTAGDEFTITTDDIPGDRHEASTTYQGLADDVRAGDRILIDDGNVQVDVTGVAGTRVRTRVAVGGRPRLEYHHRRGRPDCYLAERAERRPASRRSRVLVAGPRAADGRGALN